MAAEFKSATRYLRQLADQVKRPIKRAFLFGMVKTGAVITQLGCLAYIAEAALVDGEGVGSLILPWTILSITSLLRVSSPYWQQKYLQQATLQATEHARRQLLAHWHQQTIYGRPPSAADGALQLEPIEALKGYFGRYLVQQYLVIFSPLMILMTCFYINPVVGVLLLFSGPIIPVFMALVGMGAEKLSQKHAEQTHGLSRVFTDKLRNLSTIRLFDAGDAALQDVAVAGEDYRTATMSTLKIAFLSSAVLEFFASVAIAGVALYVGFGLLGYIDWLGADQLTLFSGLFVLLLAPEYFAPLRQFAQSYHDRAAAVGAATLLASPDKEPLARREQAVGQTQNGLISWQNLSVNIAPMLTIKYPDVAIQKSSLTVIGGASGSGKTTLLKVLLGQQPYDGALHRPEQTSAVAKVAYFPQQPFLTAASIRSNVNQYQQHNDADITQVFERLNLDTLLNQLPEGLDTKLGERGLGLSGGERRRVALARCILSNRPFIIADEPTENLDDESAAAIRNNLKWLAEQGITVIVASHDQALNQLADQTVSLEQTEVAGD
ncbi:thiol reductant ABC exporter subunit CydD [Idiomarina seosinensis]|uniref:Thiol reductant ABC exporter subunit CydD n=1 Tax=Idiomarina seosinensis TaxID=281739 RepID=A0A432ZBC5_9GAMM|nr:thiol reductant ABC exporter subunit CydD [Idiomarina seosinensis]RUO75245.1 thiol reductant ABC exporter subunit CydD [Idiomarina seosinensis]